MLKVIFIITTIISLNVYADRWETRDGVDCNTYHSFEIPECNKTPNVVLRTTEYLPEQVDFDEGKINVSAQGNKLNAKMSLKVAGQMKDAVFFSGNLSNLPLTAQDAVKVEIKRIVDEAKHELERSKTEKKKVILRLARVNIATPINLNDSDLELEAKDFLRTFKAGTTELGQAYDRLMRSNFGTGPRLSSQQKAEIKAKLEDASRELREQGIDLDIFTNCLDDHDVCESIFVDKYVRDNNNGQRQARELLGRFKVLHGDDLVLVSGEQSPSSSAVSDTEGAKGLSELPREGASSASEGAQE